MNLLYTCDPVPIKLYRDSRAKSGSICALIRKGYIKQLSVGYEGKFILTDSGKAALMEFKDEKGVMCEFMGDILL